MDKPFQIRLFGCLEVVMNGQHLEEELIRHSKWVALLAILLVNHGRAVSRDMLLSSLWPDFGYDKAVDNFYTTRSKLGRFLTTGEHDKEKLLVGTQLVSVNTRLVDLDLARFDELATDLLFERGSCRELAEKGLELCRLYRGDVLSGTYINLDLTQANRRYRHQFANALSALASMLIDEQEFAKARWFAAKGLEADPQHEALLRHARWLVRAEDRVAAREAAKPLTATRQPTPLPQGKVVCTPRRSVAMA
jgi:DNA-binding SARP family transcriptional activator